MILQVGLTFTEVATVVEPQLPNYLAVVFSADRTDVHHGVAGISAVNQRTDFTTRSTFPAVKLPPLKKQGETRLDPVWIGGMPKNINGVFQAEKRFGKLKKTSVADSVGPYFGTLGGLRIWSRPLASTLFEQKPPIPWIYEEQSLQRRIEFPAIGVTVAAERPSVNDLIVFSKSTPGATVIELNDPLVGSWVHEVPNDVYAPVRPTLRPLGSGPEFDALGPVCNVHDRPVFSVVKEARFAGRYYVYRNGLFIGYINGASLETLNFTSSDGKPADVKWSPSGLVISLDTPQIGRLVRPQDRGKGNRVSSGDSWVLANKVKAGPSCRGYDLLNINPVLTEGDESGLKKHVFVEPSQRGSDAFLDESGTIAPLSFHVIDQQRSSVRWQNVTFSSRKHFLESWGVRVGVRAGWGGEIGDAMGASTSVGVSGGYGQDTTKNEFSESVKCMSRSYAQLASLAMDRMQVRLHQDFVKDVKNRSIRVYRG